ncbi:hypothetical protein MLD38_007852 [Melastoma candidum]|uniref:Uncharacterized protein n=1 Tax=Melastoma candidum TaxID=119954 RepID=A0ACB9RW57_9MYRT|nr:hypothetical protein MLD38_007852 [Melastoma candidum]
MAFSSSSSSSANGDGKCHIRSVSLPSRSHPTTCSIEDALHRLKNFDTQNMSTFESVSCGLAKLEDLYICTIDLLDMASTQQILRRQVTCNSTLLDSSVHLLDVCGIARDLVSQVKEDIQLLQSVLRRRKGDQGMSSILADYVNFRNKARKTAKRLSLATNQIKNRANVTSPSDQDAESSAVMRTLMEVDEIAADIFQSVLRPFLNPISGTKKSRWSSILRLVHRGAVACEEKPENLDDIKHIDEAVRTLTKCNMDNIEANKNQLQEVESNINSLELALESMFRQLVRARASLLNVISQ